MLSGRIIRLLTFVNSSFIILFNFRRKYRSFSSLKSLKDHLLESGFPFGMPLSLDLGCGKSINNFFLAQECLGVDNNKSMESARIKFCDLTFSGLPFDDHSLDYITAFDLLEHIPRSVFDNLSATTAYPLIRLLNECYRCLKPGGVAMFVTPTFPSLASLQDPTHVNYITEDTIPLYFCQPNPAATNIGYGYNGKFDLVLQCWVSDAKTCTIIRSVHPR